MDLNGDGKLSKDEIKKGYETHFGKAMSDDEIDDMFAKVDTDGSGLIEYSEFVVATMNEKDILSNNKLQTAFKMFDKDGGGSISTDEIKQVLSFSQNLEPAVVDAIIKQVDANGDGEISFDEFAEMMLKESSWTPRDFWIWIINEEMENITRLYLHTFIAYMNYKYLHKLNINCLI